MSPEAWVKAKKFLLLINSVMVFALLFLLVMEIRKKPKPWRRISLWLMCIAFAMVLVLSLHAYRLYEQGLVPFGL